MASAVTESINKVVNQAKSTFNNVEWAKLAENRNVVYGAGAAAALLGGVAVYKVATRPHLKSKLVSEYQVRKVFSF
jgi:flavin-binding protein dodecin